jgi:alcohol dehydrogenase class IV|tara:strand:- start:5877 stop:6653 length:777 start_codon:yes stop_codon:yes gene_type:complete
MSLIVCSPSTQNFIKGKKFIIKGPPTKEILTLQGKYNNVIAVGGGAVVDTAKILSSTPIVCYPTTAAGASATSHSVYWDNNNKMNFESYIPKEVYFKLDFIKSLPQESLLYTKYDAISHCLDVMWSKDYYKLNNVLVEKTLKKLTNPNITPLEIIKLGHKAGSFIQQVPTTILHALSYPLTGKYKISHGKALGFLIPPLCRIFKQTVNINKLISLNNFLDVDIDFIINKAQTYSKFFNTNQIIDLNILKNELKNELYE